MSVENLPWAVRFKPKTQADLAGNREAINEFKLWLRGWERGVPEKRAAFLTGPPGVGKTVAVHVLAGELNLDVLEVNASDYRTRTRMEELIGRAATQNITIFGRRRLILFDEMEGISGREDLGGVAAINDIIKETRSPVVLIATSVTEENEEKFRPLREKSVTIEFKPIPSGDIYQKLEKIARELKLNAKPDALEALSQHSEGDLRSAINDLEALARGDNEVTVKEVEGLSVRDRQDYTPAIVYNLFAARTLQDARKALNQAYVGHEELFDWIYENLPLMLDDPRDLADAMEALSKADIFWQRSRMVNFRLMKYMINAMTGGVALSQQRSAGLGLKKQVLQTAAKLGYQQSAFQFTETAQGMVVKPVRYMGDAWRTVNDAYRPLGAVWVRGGGGWLIPYVRPPQAKWRFIRSYASRKKQEAVGVKVAQRLHVSRQTVNMEILPLMRLMYRSKEAADGISGWLELDEEESDWLRG